MKPFRYLLLCWAAVMPWMQASADSISLRGDEWYPFNGTPGDGKPGYMVELAQLAWGKAGHRVDYQLLDWDESVSQAQEGRVDCVVGAFRNDAPGLLFPKEAQGVDYVGFFAVVDRFDWSYTGTPSLAGKKIGVISGYGYGDEIDAYLKTPQAKKHVHVASGDKPLDDLTSMLMGGKIDLLLESPSVFKAKVKNLGLRVVFEELDRVSDPEGVYIACSPKNSASKRYLELLEAEVTRLRQSGELRTLMAKYGLRDWKK